MPNAPGTYGNAGYNAVVGPGFFDLDTNLKRVIRLTERQKVELRFEFFNVLNHTNFANPTRNMSSANFGRITQTVGTATATFTGTTAGAVGGSRQIQLVLRLSF